MRKTVLTYGTIAGLIIAVLGTTFTAIMMGSEEKNMDTGMILGYLTMLVGLSLIFFGVRQFRDRYQNGVISFGKAFQVGILIGLLAAVFYIAGWMIFYNTSEVAQQFPDYYVEHMKAEWAKKGMSQEEIDAKSIPLQKQMDEYGSNPLLMIAYTFLEVLPVILLITLITAFILKRRPAQLAT